MGRVASMEFNVSAGILRAKCFSFLIRILKFRLGLTHYYFAVVLSGFVLFLLVFVGRLAVRDILDCMYYFFLILIVFGHLGDPILHLKW